MKTFDLSHVRTVLCVKGNISLGFVKNRVYPVVSAEVMQDYMVRIIIQKQDRRQSLYVRHPNRFNDKTFNANNGDPTKVVKFSVVKQ